MGIIGRVLRLTTFGGAATLGTHLIWTRNSIVESVPTTDALFTSPAYKQYNPNQNGTMRDVCVRKVPLSQVDPLLVAKKGKLVEAFCAGVWGGLGKFSSVLPSVRMQD